MKKWRLRSRIAKEDNAEPEWYMKYQMLEKRIETHKKNLEKLKSEIQELETKLGFS